jgi:hypothetical protein
MENILDRCRRPLGGQGTAHVVKQNQVFLYKQSSGAKLFSANVSICIDIPTPSE